MQTHSCCPAEATAFAVKGDPYPHACTNVFHADHTSSKSEPEGKGEITVGKRHKEFKTIAGHELFLGQQIKAR
jgi:hypothetical protein